MSTSESVDCAAGRAGLPELGCLDVEGLVLRGRQGELTACELIMRRYNRRVFRVARGMLGDDDETEGVVQETYMRAFEHLGQFSGLAKFATWLTKIAVHEAIARRKRLG